MANVRRGGSEKLCSWFVLKCSMAVFLRFNSTAPRRFEVCMNKNYEYSVHKFI